MTMEDGEDNMAGPLQCTYLAELSEETNAEYSQWLATRKNKEVSPPQQHRKQEENKSSREESTYW